MSRFGYREVGLFFLAAAALIALMLAFRPVSWSDVITLGTVGLVTYALSLLVDWIDRRIDESNDAEARP